MTYLMNSFGLIGLIVIFVAVTAIGSIYLIRRPRTLQVRRNEAGFMGVDQQPTIREKGQDKPLSVAKKFFKPRPVILGSNLQKRLAQQKVIRRMPGGKPHMLTPDGRALRVYVTSNGDVPMRARQVNEFGLIHGRNFVPSHIAFF